MKEKLAALWAKVVANKPLVIKVGGSVAGALLGAVVASLIATAQEEALLEEELTMSIMEDTE